MDRGKEFTASLKNFSFDSDQESEEEIEEIEVEIELQSKRPEDKFKTDIRALDPRALVIYFADKFKETHGFSYKIDFVKELGVMKSFRERYGTDSGLMIKYLFEELGGKWSGDYASIPSLFSRGSKWIQDKIYSDMKSSTQEVPVERGEMMTSDEFLSGL